MEIRGEVFSDNIKLDDVNERDYTCVSTIIRGILKHDKNIPIVKTIAYSNTGSSVYNIVISGWTTDVDDKEWVHTFLSTARNARTRNKRNPMYNQIVSTSTTNSQGTLDGPIKKIIIRKNNNVDIDRKYVCHKFTKTINLIS